MSTTSEPTSLDLGALVEKRGEHYDAMGEHADMWIASLKTEEESKLVALKVLRGGPMRKDGSPTKLDKDLGRYGQVWRDLDHPHVARFWGLAFNMGPMPALVLDYYPDGSIVNYIKNKALSSEARLHLVYEIAQGIHYLHTREPPIIHGDIRGANVFVNEDGHAVLADYQLAFIIESSDFTSVKTAGTCRWTAPEIMSPPEDDGPINSSSLFTLASDVFSFAMTFIEIFTEQVPFASKKNDSSVIFAILDGRRPEIPSYIQSREALTLLVKTCWAQVPTERPTAQKVCDILGPLVPAQSKSWYRRFLGNLWPFSRFG